MAFWDDSEARATSYMLCACTVESSCSVCAGEEAHVNRSVGAARLAPPESEGRSSVDCRPSRKRSQAELSDADVDSQNGLQGLVAFSRAAQSPYLGSSSAAEFDGAVLHDACSTLSGATCGEDEYNDEFPDDTLDARFSLLLPPLTRQQTEESEGYEDQVFFGIGQHIPYPDMVLELADEFEQQPPEIDALIAVHRRPMIRLVRLMAGRQGPVPGGATQGPGTCFDWEVERHSRATLVA